MAGAVDWYSFKNAGPCPRTPADVSSSRSWSRGASQHRDTARRSTSRHRRRERRYQARAPAAARRRDERPRRSGRRAGSPETRSRAPWHRPTAEPNGEPGSRSPRASRPRRRATRPHRSGRRPQPEAAAASATRSGIRERHSWPGVTGSRRTARFRPPGGRSAGGSGSAGVASPMSWRWIVWKKPCAVASVGNRQHGSEPGEDAGPDPDVRHGTSGRPRERDTRARRRPPRRRRRG